MNFHEHNYLTWLPIHTEMELVVSHEQIHMSLTASAIRFPALQVSLQVHHAGVPQIPIYRYLTQVYVRLQPLSTKIPVLNKGYFLILSEFSCVILKSLREVIRNSYRILTLSYRGSPSARRGATFYPGICYKIATT